MWSRLSSPGSWSLPVLAVCAACCCKALLPLWNLGVDREHLGPGRASSLLGPHMYTHRGRDGGGRVREVERSFQLIHCIPSYYNCCGFPVHWPACGPISQSVALLLSPQASQGGMFYE